MPFKSTVGDYQTVATLETFGFLPPFTQDEIYDQIAYIIAQGWSPLVEHVHPSNSMATYWSYWKLPFFGEKDLSVIVSRFFSSMSRSGFQIVTTACRVSGSFLSRSTMTSY